MKSKLTVANAAVWINVIGLGLVLLAAQSMFLMKQDPYGPEGITESFTIFELPSDITREDVIWMIESSVDRLGVNVYKSVPSASGDIRGSDYYLFEGDPETTLGSTSTGDFPSFQTSYQATLSPAAWLPHEKLIGVYLVQGQPGSASDLVAELEALGTTEGSTGPSTAAMWIFFLIGGAWGTAVLVMWGALALAIANLLSVRLAIAGLRIATGSNRLATASVEVATSLFPVVICTTIPVFMLLGYSIFMIGGYRSATILTIGVTTAPLVLGSALLALLIVLVAMSRRSIGSIIKGARPNRPLAVAAGIIIMVSAASVGLSAGSALDRISEEANAKEADDFRAARPELFKPMAGHALLNSEGLESLGRLGEIFGEMEAEDLALLADGEFFMVDKDVVELVGDHGMVLANSAFTTELSALTLTQQEAIDHATSRPGGVAILLPTMVAEERAVVEAIVKEQLSFQATLPSAFDSHSPEITVIPNQNLGVVPRLDFANEPGVPTYFVDPVVVVVNASAGVLPDTKFGSSGVFAGRVEFDRLVDQANLLELIVGVESIEQLSAVDQADRKLELRASIAGIIAMIVSLSVASAILTTVYYNRMVKAIFLLNSTGSTFIVMHRRFILFTSVIVAVPACLALIGSEAAFGAKAGIALALTSLTLLCAIGMLAGLARNISHEALEET